MQPGVATTEGTARFRTRFPAHEASGFYRTAQEWTVSSLGIGTYLGAQDDQTDRNYERTIAAAVRGGINFIDTAINYRQQRSESAIGRALADLMRNGELRREEIVVSTKAGFLVPGAIPVDLRPEDVAGGMHSMSPAFLSDQIARSRRNLGLEAIDVFYLHNPETQIAFVAPAEFDTRLRDAFATLETLADRGVIRYYGAATWGAFRTKPGGPGALSIERMVELAREAGGGKNRFRFVQLPFNLAMNEAFTARTQTLRRAGVSALEAASRCGLTAVASASLLQARLSRELPAALAAVFPGAETDAQRALQFARSAPGITVALAGMSSVAHLTENLSIAGFAPLAAADFERVFAVSPR